MGALPLGHWMRLKTVTPPNDSAMLQIFGTHAASGPIGMPIPGEPLNVRTADSREA